jgi:hypothetical protein
MLFNIGERAVQRPSRRHHSTAPYNRCNGNHTKFDRRSQQAWVSTFNALVARRRSQPIRPDASSAPRLKNRLDFCRKGRIAMWVGFVRSSVHIHGVALVYEKSIGEVIELLVRTVSIGFVKTTESETVALHQIAEVSKVLHITITATKPHLSDHEVYVFDKITGAIDSLCFPALRIDFQDVDRSKSLVSGKSADRGFAHQRQRFASLKHFLSFEGIAASFLPVRLSIA